MVCITISFVLFLIVGNSNGQKINNRIQPTSIDKQITECPGLPQSISETIDEDLNACACSQSWYGPTCEICSSDASCSNNMGTICDQSYVVNEEMNKPQLNLLGDITNEDINKALGGKGHAYLSYESKGFMEMEFWREKKSKMLKVFQCASTKCQQIVDEEDEEVTFDCSEISCEMACDADIDDVCSSILSNVITRLGDKGMSVTCDTSESNAEGMCSIKEQMLNLYFGEVNASPVLVGSCIDGPTSTVQLETMAVVDEEEEEKEGKTTTKEKKEKNTANKQQTKQATPPVKTTQSVECNGAPQTIADKINEYGTCTCGEDWWGPSCSICQSDAACQSSSNTVCDVSYQATAQKSITAMCAMENKDINSLLGGMGHATLEFDLTGQTEIGFWRVEEKTQKWLNIFDCSSPTCEQVIDKDTGKVTYDCSAVTCAMQCSSEDASVCSDTLASVIGNIGTDGMSVTCDATQKECEIKERVLNLYFGEVMAGDCSVGSCVSDEFAVTTVASSSSSSSSTTTTTTTTTITKPENDVKPDNVLVPPKWPSYGTTSKHLAGKEDIFDSAGMCPLPNSVQDYYSQEHNCICSDDWAGPECQICQSNDVCSEVYGDGYECDSGLVSYEDLSMSQWCALKNDDINSLLKGTGYTLFNYNATHDTAKLDFWRYRPTPADVKEKWLEIFSCGGHQCRQERGKGTDADIIRYTCPNAECETTCEIGSTSACTEYIDRIVKTVGGSGITVSCNAKTGDCQVVEDTLNMFFMDVNIGDCQRGTCFLNTNATRTDLDIFQDEVIEVSASQVATYTLSTIMITFAGFVFLAIFAFAFTMRSYAYPSKDNNNNSVSTTVNNVLKEPKTSTNIIFKDLGYRLGNGKEILKNISGVANAGEILAVMGPSGAGKSTFMDIIALREKSGTINGGLYCNGEILRKSFKSKIGFVDQSDNLKGTLTVYESLMFSAMLRLPENYSNDRRKQQVINIMSALRITHIANTRIGVHGSRGISGGEKRRVSVGMELVNNPSLLLLDEPTSGLDTYNANMLIDCLHNLAWQNGTAIVTTIHQPRQNIFYKFDRLMVLADGEMVYGGSVKSINDYCDTIGLPIPSDYNPADFVIDILFKKESSEGLDMDTILPTLDNSSENEDQDDIAEKKKKQANLEDTIDRSMFNIELMDKAERKEGQPEYANAIFQFDTYKRSRYYNILNQDINESMKIAVTGNGADSDSENSEKSSNAEKLEACAQKVRFISIAWLREVAVLSCRNLIDLKRNPLLMACHITAALYFSIMLGCIYYKLDMSNLDAVQNRMGVFMLMAVFLSFTSLSALPLFWQERPLYIHERGNRFYTPSAYFISKIFFDIVPLRVFPAILLGLISHAMLGLREGDNHLTDLLIILVLISVTGACINLTLGILIHNIMTGIFTGILLMIHFMLLTNIFINFDSLTIEFLKGLKYVSFFNYAYEALVQNELVGRTIENFAITNGNGVLDQLGFAIDTQYHNMLVLVFYFLISLTCAFCALKFAIKERR